MQAASERIGRYQILESIGGGPNGMVSRAKVFGVAGFERQFAVKKFLAELTSSTPTAQALSAAARAYGGLEHPRIARMSEFGVAQGQTFTAVEYVVGLDAMRLLAETKLAGSPIAIGGALALISQAARAVGYAHGRGLSHLGLAPTNVIVTVEGDVKVTDFGILAAVLPPSPVEVARLANRIPYFAPEQLSGEATSAATDVFSLGVIAYELVTGQRAFRGDTPKQVADAILGGPPVEPALPRPIVRVLQRCLARSPFERFPDARALADALDASLRVAPVPGTRKDIGAQVKAIVDRLTELNEGNLSGMLSVQVGTGPHVKPPAPAEVGRADSIDSASTHEYERSDFRTEPSPVVPSELAALSIDSPASTFPDMARPISTVPGLAPPPIPVPKGVLTGGASPPDPLGSNTIIGIPGKRNIPSVPGVIPSLIKPRGPQAAPVPTQPMPPPPSPPPAAATPAKPSQEVSFESKTATGEPDKPAAPPPPIAPTPAPLAPPPALPRANTDSFSLDTATGQMSPMQLEALTEETARRSGDFPTVQPEAPDALGAATIVKIPPPPQAASASYPPLPAFPPPQPAFPPPTYPSAQPEPVAPPPISQPLPLAPQQISQQISQPIPQLSVRPERKGRGGAWALLILLLLGGFSAAGWYVYTNFYATKPATKVATGSGGSSSVGSANGSASVAVATPADAAAAVVAPTAGSGSSTVAVTTPVDATVAAALADAATVAVASPPDAAAAKPAPADAAAATPAETSGPLQIASTPAGAKVYLDGAEQGTTPVKLPGTGDHHTVALLLAGHELYVAEVAGHGQFSFALKPVTPHGGPAGIKVIKCKDKDRYYVFVDGNPTGMMCPTERINVQTGPHTVEVYDAVSEGRQKFDINVTDTRLSFRVRVEQ